MECMFWVESISNAIDVWINQVLLNIEVLTPDWSKYFLEGDWKNNNDLTDDMKGKKKIIHEFS